MKPRTVVILAVLVAALAAFVWFVDRDLPSSDERAEQSRKVLPVEADDVSAVAIEWGGHSVRLEREKPTAPNADEKAAEPAPAPARAGEWRITEPLQARADRSLVDGLLNALSGLDKERTLEDADRAEVGLAEPRGKVTLVTGDGDRTLEVGADVPASQNVLVGLAGQPDVWVTSRSFLTQLQRAPGDWRSHDVFAVARDDVSRVRLADGGEPVVLARRDGRFYVEQPVEDLAAADSVDQLLSDLVTLRAQRFLDGSDGTVPPLADVGLDPPREVVTAELADGGEPLEVELGSPVDASAGAAPAAPGAPGGAVYARAGGQVFETVTGLVEAAARPADDWRSHSWTELRSYEVDRIEVAEPGAAAFTLVRDGVDWKRGDETLPYTAASDFLFALTEAKGDLAAPGALPADAAPVLTVKLTTEGGDEETLSLFAPTDGGASPARSSAREGVLLLPAETVAKATKATEAVRTAEPVTKEKEAEQDDDGS